MMRTFVAVDVSAEVAGSILRFQSAAGIAARAVGPHNLHFTLQFLGEARPGAVEKARRALRAVEFSGFAVGFRGVGAFPGPRSPRVVWVGTDGGGAEGLRGLAGKVGRALAPLGFPSGRPFRPHVTVFRIGGGAGDVAGVLERFKSAEFGSQRVASIKLKRSVLTPAGPAYSDLEEVAAAQ